MLSKQNVAVTRSRARKWFKDRKWDRGKSGTHSSLCQSLHGLGFPPQPHESLGGTGALSTSQSGGNLCLHLQGKDALDMRPSRALATTEHWPAAPGAK